MEKAKPCLLAHVIWVPIWQENGIEFLGKEKHENLLLRQ
jgi:hypothetical protein